MQRCLSGEQCLSASLLSSPSSPCSAPPARLGLLIGQLVRLERELWPLAEGPWAGGEGMAHRQAWLAGLRSAGGVREVAHALLQLEAALRPLALDEEWRGGEARGGGSVAPAALPGPGAAGTPAGGGSRPASRAVSRAASGVDLDSLAGGASQGGEGSASQAGVGGDGPAGTAAAAAAAAARAADPYETRAERVDREFKGNWEMDRRQHAARLRGVNRLPLSLARKVRASAGWGVG